MVHARRPDDADPREVQDPAPAVQRLAVALAALIRDQDGDDVDKVVQQLCPACKKRPHHCYSVADLAVRWGCSENSVRALFERADLAGFLLFKSNGGPAKGWRAVPEEVERFEREGGALRLVERAQRTKNRADGRRV